MPGTGKFQDAEQPSCKLLSMAVDLSVCRALYFSLLALPAEIPKSPAIRAMLSPSSHFATIRR